METSPYHRNEYTMLDIVYEPERMMNYIVVWDNQAFLIYPFSSLAVNWKKYILIYQKTS